jgi:4-alpha-glucanotransferase
MDNLEELAGAYGVATTYENWQGVHVAVDPEVIAKVLGLLDTSKPPPPTPAGVSEHAQLPPSPFTWGWMVQVYSLRSAGSWGVGDFADLATFTAWAAGLGAGAILLNPLHAVACSSAAGDPVPPSPYSPSSRRFINPIYLRIEDTGAYRTADASTQAEVDALKPTNNTTVIDYDTVWRAKHTALKRLWNGQKAQDSEPALTTFATFNALVERHGADWRQWPDDVDADADEIAFQAWLQELCAEQLRAANAAAAGMAIGIVHDLAVGIDPGGADAWMLQDVIAAGAKIGAPPDAFNQQGQDWGLATWRPDRLAATGYAAYRDLLRGIFAHASGLRVDHVAGLWRLWWIPPGEPADRGTYVSYDADAMLGILVEEARAAGATVIGEDLGTVLGIVTQGLRERDILGSAVLWFTRDWNGDFRPPAQWPERALATISTHDLPTAAGYLSGDHVRARAEAGVLSRDVEEERRQAADDVSRLKKLIDQEGLADEDPIVALHELLARTPCRLVLASPYDVLGEIRQPNLPGTVDQYPNWRIPLPLPLEEVVEDPRMVKVAAILKNRSQPSPAGG